MMKKLILTLFIVVFSFSCSKKEEKRITRDDILIELSKKEILKRLKAPSTTVFMDSLAYVFRLDDSTKTYPVSYHVHLKYDSQNSYGVMLRGKGLLVYEFRGIDGEGLSSNKYKFIKYFDE